MPDKNTVICDYCGKEFIPHSSTMAKIKRGEQKTITCSRECCSLLKRKIVITYCDNCGKQLVRKKSHYDRQVKNGQHQYCSLKCEKEFQHKQTYEIRKCIICEKEFECQKISTQQLCSPECQCKWQTTRTGELNPRYTSIHYKCDWCGKEYIMKKYKLKQKNHFCSWDCQREWYAKEYSQTEEHKQESRERAIHMLENGQMPFVYTKPQILINNILDNNHIEYHNDYNIKYYSVDNYLDQSKLMIEVMGDYWHSNPLVFDYNNLNEVQLKRIPKDKAKHTYVKNKYNVEILYLWEYDINKNLDKCEELIKEYINNNGVLQNYHSFNYDYDGCLSLNIKAKMEY